jgi:hypothetical protein
MLLAAGSHVTSPVAVTASVLSVTPVEAPVVPPKTDVVGVGPGTAVLH